jgi:hypothetical protein
MAFTYSAAQNVMLMPEFRNVFTNQIRKSPEGLMTLQMSALVDKLGNAVAQQHATGDAWTRYVASVPFISEVSKYEWPLNQENWIRFMEIFADHHIVEYAVETLLHHVMYNDDDDVFQYRYIFKSIGDASTPENIQLVANTLEIYPLNTRIQHMGCAMLSMMYRRNNGLFPRQIDNCAKHLQLALSCLNREPRDNNSVISAIYLIVAMHTMFQENVETCLEDQQCNIVLLVFDAQDDINQDDSLMRAYSMFCFRFLCSWKAPVLQAGTHPRMPFDVIIDCMRQNSESRYHISTGCMQLEQLSLCNSDTLDLSRQHIAFFSTLISQVNANTKQCVHVLRVYRLWNVLFDCVTRPAAFETFECVFKIPLLLQSLSHLTSREGLENSVDEGNMNPPKIAQCVDRILYFLRHALSEPSLENKRQFLETNGVAVLINVISYSYSMHMFQQFEAGQLACVNIFLDLFHDHENGLAAYLTRSARKGTTVLVEFMYSVSGGVQVQRTFPNFLIDTLVRMNSMYAMVFTSDTLLTIQGILNLLFALSHTGDFAQSDSRSLITKVLQVAHTIIPRVEAQVHSLESSIFARELVMCMDSILLQYTRDLTPHNRALAVQSDDMQKYMQATAMHRAPSYDLLTLFSMHNV